MPPSNEAAWITGTKKIPLEVKPAPYTPPGANKLVIRNAAVAINPIDWLKQVRGDMIYPWVKYPFILGTDVAGEVVEVGPNVTGFQVGDRVVSFALGPSPSRNNASQSAFQRYVVLEEHMTTKIPEGMPYETAAVMPLALSTAACGLFQDDTLRLDLPSPVKPKPTGKALLIWGGSTSVGVNAIQLAVSAGYEVFTTSSPRNFDLLRRLGASRVFDYSSATVVRDIIAAFKGKTTAGALSIGQGAAEACLDILGKCQGNRFLAMATYPVPQHPPKYLATPYTIWVYLTSLLSYAIKSRLRGIQWKMISGSTLTDNGVGKAIYTEYLGEALASGSFVPAPEPMVTGKGLEKVQDAFEIHMKGVSARKVVVML